VDVDMQVAARAFAIICALVITINAVFMLVSPRAWFQLPSWIRAQGVLTEHRYSEGWRSVLVRVLGAIILVLVAGVTSDLVVEAIKK
jgi:hypothetical protein